MRPHKTGGDEERRTALGQALLGGLESLDSLVGDAAVGVVSVVCHRRLVRRAARQRTDLAKLLVCEQRLLAGELAAVGALRIEVLDHLVMKMRDAKRLGITLVAMANVEHFAKRFGAVAMFGEMLRHRDGAGPGLAQMAAKPVQAG